MLDAERQARISAKELIKSKLIREEFIIFTNEAFGSNSQKEADIEDLLDPDVFNKLVNETYSKELKGKTLNLNAQIPRIVKRYEEAFKEHNIEFHKTRPAKLFLRRIAEDPSSVITPTSQEYFEKLFQTISTRLEKLVRADRKPYE